MGESHYNRRTWWKRREGSWLARFAMVIPVGRERVTWFSSLSRRPAPASGSFRKSDQASNYTIADLARGELREETGLAARELEFQACIYMAYGFLTRPMPVFVATGLTRLAPGPRKRNTR